MEQIPQDERKQLGRTSSLMSPAVTQILEGLADDHSDSSSAEEDESISEDEEPSIQPTNKDLSAQKVLQNKQKHNSAQAPRPSSLSPNRSNSKLVKKISGQSTSTASSNEDGSGRPKNKQPHMARFHSLRSMLFQQKIEDRMKTAAQDCQAEESAAEKWRTEHEERQMHHPTIPEKDAQAKSGIGSRLKMTIRRMTTKDAGSMEKIREDGAPVEFKERPSGTSSETEEKQQSAPKTSTATCCPDFDTPLQFAAVVKGLLCYIPACQSYHSFTLGVSLFAWLVQSSQSSRSASPRYFWTFSDCFATKGTFVNAHHRRHG